MSPVRILDYGLLGFLYALGAVVVFQMLTRRVNLRGLIFRKDGSGRVSPERIQLLLVTLATCIRYMGQVSATTKAALPELDTGWLYLMGGSSGLYAVRKAWAFWRRANKISLGG